MGSDKEIIDEWIKSLTLENFQEGIVDAPLSFGIYAPVPDQVNEAIGRLINAHVYNPFKLTVSFTPWEKDYSYHACFSNKYDEYSDFSPEQKAFLYDFAKQFMEKRRTDLELTDKLLDRS